MSFLNYFSNIMEWIRLRLAKTNPFNVLLCLMPKMFNRSARLATKWKKIEYADLCQSISIKKNCSYFHIDIGKVNNACLLIQIVFLALCVEPWICLNCHLYSFHNYINVSKENWQIKCRKYVYIVLLALCACRTLNMHVSRHL